ncbi:penicillin-binding transpeptidase domain-containing protein [Bacillus sp. NTK071]|uniref:penicillin-binding transpeptidase domain-containing protein n=1 Tax=Bacillus sp. NTK071 TaxID=2802175 RepID=UPI0032E43860
MLKLNYRSFIMVALFILLLASCSSPPSAIDAFDTYVKDWNKQEFSSMYDQLSPATQKSISKEEFVERYKTIYKDVEARDLKVTFKKPEEEPEPNEEGEVSFPFSVSMQTLAGEVAFENEATLVLTEEEDSETYGVNWNPSFIFKELKEGEEVSINSAVPTRGEITDRNSADLAVNGAVNEIGVVPEKIESDKDKILSELSEVLKVSVEDLEKDLNQSWVQTDPTQFVPIKSVMKSEKELVKEAKNITGVMVSEKTERIYPFGESAAHLTGYIRNLQKEDLEEYAAKGYSSYEKIGVAGLEQVYEEKLHGETGWTIAIKGKDSESDKVIASKPKVDGENIQVTIDSTVQEMLYKQLDGEPGTAVALHPTTGETLALTSSPSYNPNDFTLGFDEGEYAALADDKNQPFSAKFNKTYSPGSTVKPLTAAIALQDGDVDPKATEKIDGLEWQKDSSWGGYHVTRVKPADPEVTLEEALIHSDNIYFARKALDLGAEKFEKGLESFLIGQDVDFPFPTENSSVSNKELGSGILLADSGYGQGQLQVSPYHLAMTYTTFANEGKMIKPTLKMDEDSPQTVEVVSPEVASVVNDALSKVVSSPEGTAHDPVVKGISIAGKTGTAELKGAGEETGQENGLFVAYNTDRKDLLIAMMVENASSHDITGKVKKVFAGMQP